MCSTITVVKELDAEPHNNSYSFDSLIINIKHHSFGSFTRKVKITPSFCASLNSSMVTEYITFVGQAVIFTRVLHSYILR